MNPHVQTMLRLGRLRTEDAARGSARIMLDKAREFLQAASTEVAESPTVAFTNAYTAARQAVTALLWSEGLRADSRREHEIIAEYARVAIPATRDLNLADLDVMRRQRHVIEYEPGRSATTEEARRACAFTARVVAEVARRLAVAP